MQTRSWTYRRNIRLDYTACDFNPRAIVLYVHGGSFLTGSRHDRLATFFLQDLTQRGYAFATMDYRKGPAGPRALRGIDVDIMTSASAASVAFYPEIAARLLGPMLYRATVDVATAVRFLRTAGPKLAGIPLVTIGMSAGGLATMGYAAGLDGLAPTGPAPCLNIALSCVPPQPWRPGASDATGLLLTARGDAVFPRRAVARGVQVAQQQGNNLSSIMIPYGQHNRPVREIIQGIRKDDNQPWSLVLSSAIAAAVERAPKPHPRGDEATGAVTCAVATRHPSRHVRSASAF